MKLDSKYFDMIRIRRPEQERAPKVADELPLCQWKGCREPGVHRAPKGRRRERDFYLFCPEHIRQYNASYNYFDGMSDGEVEEFQRSAVYGHRPTWKLGENASGPGAANGAGRGGMSRDAQRFYAWRAQQARSKREPERRRLRPLERKSLQALGLAEGATTIQIKARFKELVKRHHPDSNGGDRACEDRLREIIQAYNYLKQVGLA